MATIDAHAGNDMHWLPGPIGESTIVRQMVELVDGMSDESAESASAIRDVAVCLQFLAQAWPASACSTDASILNSTPDKESFREPQDDSSGDNRFEIRRLLGHGGFGVVLLVYDRRLGRDVALKVPRPEILVSQNMRQRFLREAQAAASLDHPNIVPVYDAGEIGPIWFIASRYIAGPTLAEWLCTQQSSISQMAAAEAIAIVAEAVHYAHQRGVLHRDLKPSNVLLEPKDGQPLDGFPFTPKLADFGLAKRLEAGDDRTRDGALVGTPRYMAPEQASGRPNDIGVQTDVYGLAIVLYELLTGSPPHVSDTDVETMRQVIEDPVSVASLQQRHVHRDLQTICLKGLEKDPTHRYDTANALAEDLRRFLAGEPITARPIGHIERVVRWCRRRPLQAALCAALVLVSVAAVAGISWQWMRAEQGLRLAKLETARAEENLSHLQLAFVDLAWVFDEADLWSLNDDAFPTLLKYKLRRYADDLFPQYLEDQNAPKPIAAALYAMNAKYSSLNGQSEDAKRKYRKSIDLWRDVLHDNPDRPEYTRAFAVTLFGYANHLMKSGSVSDAVRDFDLVHQLLAALKLPPEDELRALETYADLMTNLGYAHARRGQNDEAVRAHQLANKMWHELAQRSPKADFQAMEAMTLLSLAARQNRLVRDFPGAIGKAHQARRLLEENAQLNPSRRDLDYLLARALRDEAFYTVRCKGPLSAIPLFEQSINVYRAFLEQHPADSTQKESFVEVNLEFAQILLDVRGPAEALPYYRTCAENWNALLLAGSLSKENESRLTMVYCHIGDAEVRLDKAPEAVAAYRRAIELAESLYTSPKFAPKAKTALIQSDSQLGELLRRDGRNTEAAGCFHQAESFLKEQSTNKPNDLNYQKQLRDIQTKLQDIEQLSMAGRPSLAAPKDSAVAQNSPPQAKSEIAPVPIHPEKAKDAQADEPNLIGRLVDETGAPVTDAEIELTFRRNYQRRNAKSDSDGRYKFVGIATAGEYEIEIHSQRWVGIVDRKDLPRVDLKTQSQVVRDFTLPRACQLTVEVVDDHGQPIKNLSVMSSLATDNQNFASRATTNKKGRATLTGLKPSSEERLVATMGGTTPYTRRTLKLDDPSTPAELKIVLPVGETVTGKALCSDGKPAAGWRINAVPTWWHFGMSPMGQLIAADGTFSLPNVGPDRYNVIVSIPTGQRMSIAKPVLTDTALPAGTKPLAIKIDYPSPDSQASISGHITYVGGKLERGMHIFANGSDNRHGSSFVEPGKQDFEIGPIPRGTYTIQFDSTEIEPLTLPDVVIPSDKKLEVEVKVRGEISLRGTVVYADGGKPVTKYRAQIAKIRTLKGPNYDQDSNWHHIDDAAGAFNMRVAGPGIYVVQVSADGLAMAVSPQINTETKVGPVRIELSKGSPLTGIVVDEQGRLVDGAEVTPLPNAGVVRDQVVGQLVPGDPVVEAAGGKFTLPQLAASRGVIRVTHPGFAPTILDTNASDNKTASGSVKVVLHPGATVRGRVYDAEGRPQANAGLRFQDQDGYGGSDDEKYGQLASVTTDAEGKYEVRNIPARYCHVQRDDPWKSLGTVRHAIVTENGKTQTLDFGGTTKLTGRIVVNGTPLANGRVQLSGENPSFGIYKAYARSDQNGAFTFWGTPPGERTLYFANSDQSNSWVRVKRIHAETGSQNLGDLASETATLSVVIQGESGASLDGASVQLQEFNPIWPFGNTAGKVREHTNREAPYVLDDVPIGNYELIYYRPNQFAVRQRVDIEPNSREKSVVVKVPSATASLDGKLSPSICGPDGCRALNVWSSDGRLAGAIMPTQNGTYQLKNVPAGEYVIKDKDTRNSPALLAVSLRDGEHKTLDITADTAKYDTKPYGFAVVDVFTSDGVPIPGCEFQFDDSANAPTLSSSQNGHMDFVGKPGGHQVTIAYPGFKPVRLMLQFKPVGKDGRALRDVEQRVQLQQRGE
jgi:tetratricopeptide (TPR) repeat protein